MTGFPHHHFDSLAYQWRAKMAGVVNRFAPTARDLTAATIGYISPTRVLVALYRAERYAVNHPDRLLVVDRKTARSLQIIVKAAANQ